MCNLKAINKNDKQNTVIKNYYVFLRLAGSSGKQIGKFRGL